MENISDREKVDGHFWKMEKWKDEIIKTTCVLRGNYLAGWEFGNQLKTNEDNSTAM